MSPRFTVSLAALAASVAFGLGAVPAAAAPASCVGSCGAGTAEGDVTAPPVSSAGPGFGWVSTFGGVDGGGQLAGVGGTNGSAFTTASFTAAAGEVLKYNFNFITSDGQATQDGFIYEDYGFVQLIDANTDAVVAMLFNARTEPNVLTVPGSGLPPISPGVTLDPPTSSIQIGTGPGGGPLWSPLGDSSGACWGPGCGFTGWIGSTYAIVADGDYRLTFGVSNWGDTAYQTGLAYNGITIGEREIEDSVPEPASWALMLLGFGGLGAVLRHRRRALATA